ncbi:hypothetical protein MHU86_23572 [Fragilaria crotonensis]|nr:hypothetical protein MHU86_23572 [Fragilaria crotonensis]
MMRYFDFPGGGLGGGPVDLSMALLGDVRAAQIPEVEVDNSHFALIGGAGIRVLTVAGMPDQLAAAPPGTYLGPYAADAELVRPRITQIIPTKYAAALVHRDGVSPDTAFQEFCTARGGGGDLAALPAVAQTFPLLLLPTAISDHVAAKVLHDLPGQQGLGTTMAAQPGMEPMLAAVQQLAENVGVGNHGAREPKGVQDAYRETYPLLQRYCRVSTVEELAPLWGHLARGGKARHG